MTGTRQNISFVSPAEIAMHTFSARIDYIPLLEKETIIFCNRDNSLLSDRKAAPTTSHSVVTASNTPELSDTESDTDEKNIDNLIEFAGLSLRFISPHNDTLVSASEDHDLISTTPSLKKEYRKRVIKKLIDPSKGYYICRLFDKEASEDENHELKAYIIFQNIDNGIRFVSGRSFLPTDSEDSVLKPLFRKILETILSFLKRNDLSLQNVNGPDNIMRAFRDIIPDLGTQPLPPESKRDTSDSTEVNLPNYLLSNEKPLKLRATLENITVTINGDRSPFIAIIKIGDTQVGNIHFTRIDNKTYFLSTIHRPLMPSEEHAIKTACIKSLMTHVNYQNDVLFIEQSTSNKEYIKEAFYQSNATIKKPAKIPPQDQLRYLARQLEEKTSAWCNFFSPCIPLKHFESIIQGSKASLDTQETKALLIKITKLALHHRWSSNPDSETKSGKALVELLNKPENFALRSCIQPAIAASEEKENDSNITYDRLRELIGSSPATISVRTTRSSPAVYHF